MRSSAWIWLFSSIDSTTAWAGRIDVEPDDVADLGGEVRVVRELEGADAVRLEPVRAPDALDVGEADAGRLGHGAPRPVGRLAGRLGERQGDDPLAHLGPERRDARRAGLVAQKALDALCREALLPAPDGGLALARPPHDRDRAEPVGRGEHDRGAPDVLLRAVAVRHDGFQPVAVRGGHVDDDPGAHRPDSHAITATGIPCRTFPSPSDH